MFITSGCQRSLTNSIATETESTDPNQSSKYLDAVREFADNVLKYGRDTYGPKQTPLFVDGVNVNTHEPVKWISPKGDALTATETEEWILSNFASQQTLLRTLDGLSAVTGDTQYRDAAKQTIKYAFENLQTSNGLLPWGGHQAYNATADTTVGTPTHELKLIHPYYELMWKVDPQATEYFIGAFWSGHILDWSTLNMDRHCYEMFRPFEEPWNHEYKGGPVPFQSRQNINAFFNTGAILAYSGAMLTHLSGDEQPLVWSKRLVQRYVDTRDPNIGISAYNYTQNNYSPDSSAQRFPVIPFISGMRDYPEERHVHPWLTVLLVGDKLGEKGRQLIQWVVEEMTAWGKVAYRKEDNSFIPMLIDGTNIEGYVDAKFPKGLNAAELCPAGPQYFWAYSAAYRATGDAYIWEMIRNIAIGNEYGDIGLSLSDSPELHTETDCSHAYTLLGFLMLYEKTKKPEFLEMARRIGDNIILNKFHKGFFVPSKKHTYTFFDCFEPLALLHLVTTLNTQKEPVPTVWPSLPIFTSSYRFKQFGVDRLIIYPLTDSNEPPFSIHEAASIGDIILVQRIIENGTDVDSIDYYNNRTALHRAAISGRRDVVELLLAKGADIDRKDNDGRTPLDYALQNGHTEIAELLIAQGATVSSIHVAVQVGDLEKVNAFLEQDADVNAKDKQGKTVLFYAVEHNHKDIVELLIAKGADVNAKEDGGYTPLYYALWYGNKDLTTLLISKGAEVNVEPEKDYPLIYYAVWNEDLDTVKLLVAKGAKFDVKILEDRTAFHYAVGQGSRDIAEFLVSKGIDASTFHVAAGMGDLARVKNHIEQGADVNTQDELGWTPLYWAASLGQTEVAKLLIDKGADVRTAATDGGTALHQAAQAGDNELVELLLSKGADVNAKDKQGATPLFGAASGGYSQVVALLIAKGADVNAKTQNNRTPLHRAVLGGHKDVVEILITNGADVAVKDSRSRTPLDLAKLRKHIEIVEILTKAAEEQQTTEKKP